MVYVSAIPQLIGHFNVPLPWVDNKVVITPNSEQEESLPELYYEVFGLGKSKGIFFLN